MAHHHSDVFKLICVCIASFSILTGCTSNTSHTSESTANETAVGIDVVSTEPVQETVPDNTALEETAAPQDVTAIQEVLLEKIEAMRSIMQWYVYGCIMIGYDEDVTYTLDNGNYYFLIDDPVFSEAGVHSIDTYKEYLHQYFSYKYIDRIFEKSPTTFLEHDNKLYIIASSGAPSDIYPVENFVTEIISDEEVKVIFNAYYKLFDYPLEPVTLEFSFVFENGSWLCNDSPAFGTCVQMHMPKQY